MVVVGYEGVELDYHLDGRVRYQGRSARHHGISLVLVGAATDHQERHGQRSELTDSEADHCFRVYQPPQARSAEMKWCFTIAQ